MNSLLRPIDLPTRVLHFKLGHRPALDGIRGLAVVLVLIHHANFIIPLPFMIMSGGFLGVDLFFVLSGFLISSLILEEHESRGRISFKKFYVRRALRLFPAAAMVTLFSICIGLSKGFDWVGITPLRLLSIVGYFTNWLNAYQPDNWILGHFWSLAIEEQFYLLWPTLLVGLLMSQRQLAAISILTLALSSTILMAILCIFGSPLIRLYSGSDTRAFALLAGCFTAMILHDGSLPVWLNAPRRKALAQAGLVFFTIMAVAVRDGLRTMYLGGFALVAASASVLILHIALDKSYITALFENRILRWLGRRSYGIYLWHWPIYFLLSRLSPHAFIVPLAVIGSVLVAALSYVFVELPFLSLKHRYSSVTVLDSKRPPTMSPSTIPDTT